MRPAFSFQQTPGRLGLPPQHLPFHGTRWQHRATAKWCSPRHMAVDCTDQSMAVKLGVSCPLSLLAGVTRWCSLMGVAWLRFPGKVKSCNQRTWALPGKRQLLIPTHGPRWPQPLMARGSTPPHMTRGKAAYTWLTSPRDLASTLLPAASHYPGLRWRPITICSKAFILTAGIGRMLLAQRW